MKKLALVVPSDQETYDYETSYKCFKCPSGSQEFKEDARVSPLDTHIQDTQSECQS
jgi:hypothetical protein